MDSFFDTTEYEEDKKIVEQQKKFAKLWPNYCESCKGEYTHVTYDRENGMWDVDCCNALGKNQCHRCKKFGLTPSKELSCKFCGWNYVRNEGDFMPQL